MVRVGLHNDIDRLASENASLGVYVLASVLVLFLLLCTLYVSYERRCENHVRAVRVHVEVLRRSVKEFIDLNERQPMSLDEVRRFHHEHGSQLWEIMYVDLTSGKQKEVPEYRELNDRGGYFYDPNSGEVRLNLTMPVKEYLRWYRGKYADQVPSEW